MYTLLQDLRYALRMLLRQPVFSGIAILTLALGIGANTAIFSIIDAALLRPLPYREADRLVRVWSSAPERGPELRELAVSYPRYEAIRDGQDVFEALAVDNGWRVTLTGHGDPDSVRATNVSASFFGLLGVTPGRSWRTRTARAARTSWSSAPDVGSGGSAATLRCSAVP